MIDLRNQLEEFVEYAKYMALNGENPLLLYESASYKRLSDEYDNIDQLIERIFETTTVESFIKEKLDEEWSELRLRHIDSQIERNIDVLSFRMSSKQERLYRKFIDEHGKGRLNELAREVINKRPYDEVEVYAEDKRRYERNNPKSGARRIEKIGSVPGGNSTLSSQRRLRDRLNDEDD